uniref:aarF domain-containing protein kinase 1 n=1 Tax=Myxine glutinosa TaxID=7769 RepID=UPI00358FFE0D
MPRHRILVLAGLTGLAGLAGFAGLVRPDVSDATAIRMGRAIYTTVTISADYMMSLRHLDHGTPEYWSVKSQVHLRSAVRLHNLCRANRGTFVKVGQHLGTLEYLLPEEYTQTLKVLHSSAPASPLKEVKAVIREDLGHEPEELFQTFDSVPLGAASLAQVHRAVLKDGRTVAVKVQHRQVQQQAIRDLQLMEVLVHTVAWLFPEFRFLWLLKEARKNLPVELDFMNEGRNAEKISGMLQHFGFLKVPHIIWEYSRKRVLTMEFVDGGQINDKEYMQKHNIDVNEVSRKLGRMYSEMIFVNGFVHCDPHPGNVLVRKDPNSAETQLILLDHGLYLDLSVSFRLQYCRLWLALIRADIQAIERHSRALGAGDLFPLFACILTARPWKVVLDGIDRVPISLHEAEELQADAAHYLSQISGLLDRVPREMLLLIKTNDLLRGVEATLRTRASASSFLVMARSCVQALGSNDLREADYWLQRLRISLQTVLSLSQIQIFEALLWLQSCPLVLWLHKTLCRGLATAQG